MAIDTGKILNIDMEEYIGTITDRRYSSYNLVGVHCQKEDISEFASLVPNEAEVVVNYQHVFFGAANIRGFEFLHHQMGTALIPKGP